MDRVKYESRLDARTIETIIYSRSFIYEWLRLNCLSLIQWRSLIQMTGGGGAYIPKNSYRTGGSKTYIPKNFYTKTKYITLLSEKFGWSGSHPRPFYISPLVWFVL
ncbi:hypothetical protein Hanom_Chr15g01391771 [Helianthus anomalus]